MLEEWESLEKSGHVFIYTDGSCFGNPGPGGYGVVLIDQKSGLRKEISGSLLATTNNRAELLAAIKGLEALRFPCVVILFSDSKYVVESFTRGWIYTWRQKGWRTSSGGPVANRDLWERLLELCAIHKVEFSWVRGHNGNIENERCDALAVEATKNVYRSETAE